MISPFIGIIAIAVIALIGWGIAELKNKALEYKKNKEETAVETLAAQQLHEKGYNEMSISDVISNISTNGFKAI